MKFGKILSDCSVHEVRKCMRKMVLFLKIIEIYYACVYDIHKYMHQQLDVRRVWVCLWFQFKILNTNTIVRWLIHTEYIGT